MPEPTTDEEAALHVKTFMMDLVGHLKGCFPYYASALAGELAGKKMTNDRWNRITAILSSLAALPGRYLTREEHDARNPALSAVMVAQKMATYTFGGRGSGQRTMELAVWRADEIWDEIDKDGDDGEEEQEER